MPDSESLIMSEDLAVDLALQTGPQDACPVGRDPVDVAACEGTYGLGAVRVRVAHVVLEAERWRTCRVGCHGGDVGCADLGG